MHWFLIGLILMLPVFTMAGLCVYSIPRRWIGLLAGLLLLGGAQVAMLIAVSAMHEKVTEMQPAGFVIIPGLIGMAALIFVIPSSHRNRDRERQGG